MEKLIGEYKIAFTKGDTYALAIKFKNITEDLRLAYFTVKENADDEPLIQKSLGAGIDKVDDRAYKNEKTYKLQIQASDTACLEPRVQYLYDLQVTVGNVVKTVLSGVFTVSQTVTGVSGTSTDTLEIEVDDTLEVEVETTSATNGIAYETDPVANAKIGDMTTLDTTAKGTLVQAINEAHNGGKTNETRLNNILNGTTTVPNATGAEQARNYNTQTGTIKSKFAEIDTKFTDVETRLQALGFSEGVASSELSNVTSNSLTKKSKYVIFNFTAENPQNSDLTTITIPDGFRPMADTIIMCNLTSSVLLVPNYPTVSIPFAGEIRVKTDGSIEYTDAEGVTLAIMGTIEKLEILNAGWETN